MSTVNDSGPLHALTAFQRDMLATIAHLEGHKGLAIKETMQEEYDGKQINHGRLYGNLNTLVETGLVNKTSTDGRTNCYDITPRGRSELEANIDWQSQMLGDFDE